MRLSSLTTIGLETNANLDANISVSLEDVHAAAQEKNLVAFLQEKLADNADLSLILSDPTELIEVETALSDAASAFYGRESRKVGVASNGLCLVIAIVFQAIQTNFRN